MSQRPPSDSPYEFAPQSQPPVSPAAGPGKTVEPAPVDLIERTCPHCGFRIVGRPPRGRCPDCAAGLDEVATDLLQFSDRTWILATSNGVLLFAAGTVLQVVATAMTWFDSAPAVGSLLHAIAAVVGAAGVWLASTAEPGSGFARSPLAPFARMAAILVAGLWVFAIFSARQAAQLGPVRHPDATPPIPWLTVIVLLATAAEALLVALHCRTLARRVPSDEVTSQLFNVGAVTLGMCLVLALLQLIGMANAEGVKYTFFVAFPMIGGMSIVVVWAVWTLLRLAIELRHCATAGENIVARQALRAQAAQAKR